MDERNPYEPPRAVTPVSRSTHPRSKSKIFRGPLTLFAVLTVIAAVSFNLAMMIMVLSVFIAALVLLWVIAGLFQKDPAELASRVQYLGAMVAMVPVGGCALKLQHHVLDMRMEPLIAAIEAHRAAHDSYPAKLDDLELTPPRCNAVGGFGMRPMYHPNEGSYSITCMTFGFNHHTYRPAKRRWENWD